MNLKIKRKTLVEAIKFSNTICASNTDTSPVLSSLLFNVKKDSLVIFACNSTITTSFEIKKDFECSLEGKFLIKSKILYDIVSKITEDEIIFRLVDGLLNLKTSKSEFSLKTLDFNYFPKIDFSNFKPKYTFNFKTEILNEIEKKLSSSLLVLQTNQNNNFRIFNSFYFCSNSNLLEVVSTDSFKLSYLKYDVDMPNFSFNLDPLSLKILNTVFKVNETVEFNINEDNKLLIKYNDITLLTRLIEGNFPSFKKLIPESCPIEFELSKTELLNSLERGLVLNSNKKRPVVNFKVKNYQLLLSYNSEEIGYSSDILEIKPTSNNEIELCYNINYLISILKNFETDLITIHINNANSPMLLTENSKNNFIQIITGIRI